MNCTIIFFRKIVSNCYAIAFLFLIAQQEIKAQSIPVYASSIVSEDNVDVSANAIDGNMATRARIRASSGVALGIGAYTGYLEIQFPSLIPANTTSFVKIQTDDNLLPALLSGTLGNLLSGVLGTALIGNQEFTVEAKNGTTVVLDSDSQVSNDFATPRLRIITNANNEYFIAITPSQAYKSIRLTNRVGSLVGLGNTKRLDVYEAFYIGTPDICGGASYTSFDGSGLSLDLLGLGGAGVTNPNYVLDANPNNFSQLSMGILGVAASVEQTVYFDGTSQPTDQFFVKLKVDPSLLAVGVANNIHIVAANGPNVVQDANLNSLLNLDLLTLLQGNQTVTIPFSPNAIVNRITVRYNSLLNVQLTQSLDLYGITRAPALPVITDVFTSNPVICSGSSASLVAQTGTGTELRWYSQPEGGAALATVSSGQPYVTNALTQNTTFYVAARKTGCTEESLRVKVAVTVIDVPTAADITIPTTLSACNGSVVLSPASSIGGAVFKYYKDQLKTQQITTGFSGDAGVTYAVNPTTGELTITGLTALNSPYHYFISLTVNGLCENAANTLKEVIVNFSSTLALNVQPTIQGCGSVNLRDAILNFDNSSDIVYHFSDSSHTPITAEAATDIQLGGTYYIQATSASGSCSSLEQQVVVTINPEPVLTITSANLVVNLNTSVTLNATANAPITWYDSNGNALPSNTYGPFTTAGFYTFTAIAGNGTCSVSSNVFVTVIDPAECPVLTERVYADSQSWSSIITGGVADAGQAIDSDPRTYSTITTGLGLLGIGTTWQTLQWNQTVTAGTPVTVKLGSQYSALILAGAYSVVGTKRNTSGVPVDIGAIQPVSGSLLNLLSGENSFEYTFVPSDNSGPKDYDGIRIIVGSLLSAAQSVKVYEAYYDKPVTQVACNSEDVKDVFYGAVDLGVGAATALVGVDSPYNAIDADETTYATLYSGAGILAASDLTISFRTPTLAGDSLRMIISRPATILNLSLLSGFSVQMYMGNTPVGLPLDSTSSLLELVLLNGGTEAALIVHPQTQPYDKIKIRLGGVVGVLDLLRVHDIQRVADTSILNADTTNTIEACPKDTLRLAITPEPCATFIWYDAPVGGNVVSTGTSFTVPANLAAGTYTYYIQPVRFGCEAYSRGTATVIVGQTAPPMAIAQLLINGGTNPILCSTTGNVTLQAVVNSTMTITNPVFYWYSYNGTSQQLIQGETTATLALTGLPSGTHTYYVGLSSDEYCETAEADRATVTITILPFSTPSDITADDATICQTSGTAVLTPTTTQPNPQFFWFFTNSNSQPITDGATVGGLTFAISATGALTVSGLTNANSPYTYYVGMTSDATCLNQNGDFKPVNIIVNDPGTPTTTDTTQDFCLVNNPTVANIQANETNVIWYNTPTLGTALASTDALIDDAIYYGALVDSATGCESAIRLAVTVNINDTPTPTTTDATQDFCLVNNPTVANIQVNEPNVIWYSTATGGTALPSGTVLIDDTLYYGALVDPATGCESAVRLTVTVNINDAPTPTTTDATQDFCLISAPTVANIQVNEPGVIWYDAVTGGAVINATTALIDDAVYYGVLVDATTGCESAVRLAVTVNINDTLPPTTTDDSQDFCLITAPTIANIQVNEPGVIWYNAANGGTALVSTAALIDDAVYYGALVDAATGCESSVRLAITVNINDAATPTTTDTTQDFCLVTNPTVANIQVNETGVIWYSTPTGSTALAAATALVDDAIYYAALIDATTGCESAVRLAVTVNINDSGTPTTTDDTQDFCLINAPTIANIQVNETGVLWYTSATGGTALAATTALTDNTIYYGSLVGISGCESTTRLAVTVNINDANTPTTNNTTQSFCIVDNPTVANIQVNETGVIWYNVATGGTPLASTTALVDNTIYYAALVDAATGCESTIRLAVTVTFPGTQPPTIQGGGAEACVFEEVTYTTTAGMTNYVWTVTDGTIVSGGQTTDNSVTVTWPAIGAGTIAVTYFDSCIGNTSASLDLVVNTCSDLTITKTVDNSEPGINDTVVFTITVNNIGSGELLDVVVNELLPSGYVFLSASATMGTYDNASGIWNIPLMGANKSATLTLSVQVLSTGDYLNVASILSSNPVDLDLHNNRAEATVTPLCLVVYNEFSPNGDGSNELFRVDCIENYPNNKLHVYNRYGTLVYDKNHYNNDWDGTANVSGAINVNDKLPAGTYYYVLDIGVDNIVKTGWLAIAR